MRIVPLTPADPEGAAPEAETNPDTPPENPDAPPAAEPSPPSSDTEPSSPPAPDEPTSTEDAITAALKALPKEKAEGEEEAEGGDPDAAEEPAEKPDKAEKPEETKANATVEGDGDDDDPEADPTEDELKAMRPKVQKRIKQLLSQRNTARRELDGVKPDAEAYREIRGFMQSNGLEDAEVQQLFRVGSLLKANTVESAEQALGIIMPLARELMSVTGRSIPTDLKAKIDSGEVTEEVARQMARERATRLSAERTAEAATSRVTETQRQQQTEQFRSDVNTAVQAWQQKARSSDPDFDKKEPFLQASALEVYRERGPAKTADEAVANAEEALRRVTDKLRAAMPAPKPTPPKPTSGSSGNRPGAAAQSNSLEDAIRAAVATPAN